MWSWRKWQIIKHQLYKMKGWFIPKINLELFFSNPCNSSPLRKPTSNTLEHVKGFQMTVETPGYQMLFKDDIIYEDLVLIVAPVARSVAGDDRV